jgi:hypothetical protein
LDLTISIRRVAETLTRLVAEMTHDNQIQHLLAPATNLKVMRTAPDESTRRKLSGSSLGWRAAIASALALVVATASARLAKADVSVSTVTPCFNHSTANIAHQSTENALPHEGINLPAGRWVPRARLPRGARKTAPCSFPSAWPHRMCAGVSREVGSSRPRSTGSLALMKRANECIRTLR